MSQCPFCDTKIQGARPVLWYHRGYSLFISFLFVGPLMLPLVWTHPRYSRTKKAVITAVIMILMYAVWRCLSWSVGNIKDYYKVMSDALSGKY